MNWFTRFSELMQIDVAKSRVQLAERPPVGGPSFYIGKELSTVVKEQGL